MHEPRRAYQQKLDVLKKRWFLAFNFMPVELTYPGDDKNNNGYEPKGRDADSHDEGGKVKT